ncbi:MBL fold metallo-hydrolase [Paeniglutamicibacter antarcticus]|uniref:MBL fold metallo-hydrolase n=1 Tax=Paeniglutamicibacter antarcticus TaxID=494023 RepID=A0ABP9TJN3_9MICC
MIQNNVAKGIHLVSHANVNCYIVQQDERFMMVDAGLPAMWGMITDAIRALGLAPERAEALVLTHAHFDHLGVAARMQKEYGTPLWIHPQDAYIAMHPYRYKHQKARWAYPFKYPRAIPILGKMVLAGAMNVKGVNHFLPLAPGPMPALPGAPKVLYVPGHTNGHCALHFPDRNTLITGDALVTLDPYTARKGPRIVAAAATADTTQALESLMQLAAAEAHTILPGHGGPYHGGIAEAVAHARSLPIL